MRTRLVPLLLDSKAAARAAELRYATDAEPGIRRRRHGRGFRYLRHDGRPVSDGATLSRIRALAIPPAWQNVWICASHDGHIQATGHDARGRKQYRYHRRWRVLRDAAKYEQVVLFAEALPKLRARLERDLAAPGLPRRKVVAAVVELMQRTCLRVGNDCYADANKSYGLTTLRDRHARIRGSEIHLSFRGKGGKVYEVQVSDPRLARVVRRCREIPGQRLFQYRQPDGSYRAVGSSDVNGYLKQATGQPFSAKNFRTWGATLGATLVLGGGEPSRSAAHARSVIAKAIASVAAQLGNTAAICRKSYVHPVVVDAYSNGTLHGALKRARATLNGRAPRGLRAEEALVLAFLRCALPSPALAQAA